MVPDNKTHGVVRSTSSPEWNARILRVKSYFRHERSTYVLQNIKTYVLRCTTIGFKQKYEHRSSRRADMNLRYKSEFTVEIGQYFVGRRSLDCVIWHHSYLYFYIKRHILRKNIWSQHRIEDVAVFLLLMSLKWLRNPGNLSTAQHGFTPTGQRGKWYEKIFFTFDFYSLPWQRHIGARIIPCHCISIKRILIAIGFETVSKIIELRYREEDPKWRSYRHILLQTRTRIMTINQHDSV